ncbi:hypothetical protein JOF41_004553 [Saccharothrix coeruleofusca]|uniref:hypothetical protein n=1 Tax=Saccharothrix coeruleofusca TaxID=33919 RepID=UPI001AEAB67C|nr:hypothetical protein [Saccharothrix coeruleofusca]MBP2338375.1 hypothetical protein [Saccharothrix coeruleofusca]
MRHTNRATVDLDALGHLFTHRVAKVSELIHLGLSGRVLLDRCRPGGPWQLLLPGVLLLDRTPPTRWQLAQAALRHAGPGALLTGLDAVLLHGLHVLPAVGPVHVLATRRAPPVDRVRVTRARALPALVLRKGFPTAPLPRAVADAVRFLPGHEAVRALLAEAVRAGVAVAELRAGLRRGCEGARRVLAELDRGGPGAPGRRPPRRVEPPAPVRRLLDRSGVPPPRWGVPLRSAEGRALGSADAWWDEFGVAWQFRTPPSGSRALAATGVVVVQTSARELRHAPEAVGAHLLRALAAARARPRPAVAAGEGVRTGRLDLTEV